MSAYFQEPDGRIRADFAWRIGKLFSGYEKYPFPSDSNERFDATLTLVLLQSLLTSCSELIADLKDKGMFARELADVPSLWGLRKDMVVRNTFPPSPLTHMEVIKRLRDAVSHPNFASTEKQYPVTGFFSLTDMRDQVCGFSFVTSPDIRLEGQPKVYAKKIHAEKKLASLRSQFGETDGNLTFTVRENERCEFEVCRNGEPYVRIFQIDVSLPVLKTLLREVSNFLAQPIRENWDGRSVISLVA